MNAIEEHLGQHCADSETTLTMVKDTVKRLEEGGANAYASAHRELTDRCAMLQRSFETLDQEVSTCYQH